VVDSTLGGELQPGDRRPVERAAPGEALQRQALVHRVDVAHELTRRAVRRRFVAGRREQLIGETGEEGAVEGRCQVAVGVARRDDNALRRQDRKSTRLNSSHVAISYAVFCMKKTTIRIPCMRRELTCLSSR